MPKKKTGQRKKAEKQKERQRNIRSVERPLALHPCNFSMVRFYNNHLISPTMNPRLMRIHGYDFLGTSRLIDASRIGSFVNICRHFEYINT